MLTLPFQILTCSFVLMRTKLMQKLNRNLTEEENSSQRLKILTQITVEDENELAEIQEKLTSVNDKMTANVP